MSGRTVEAAGGVAPARQDRHHHARQPPSDPIQVRCVSEQELAYAPQLGLPDIQGLELLTLVRAQLEGMPIVVLSSRGDEAGKVDALDEAPMIM